MRIAIFSIIVLLTIPCMCYAEDTPHYSVLSEFVRELVETKNNEVIAKSEFASIPQGNTQETMMSIIRNGTRVKLKLSETINRLKQIHLDKPYDTLIPSLTEFYTQKLNLYEDMVTTAKTFAAGPQPSVDYGKLAAHMPEITASVDYVDESIFKVTPMVFMLVISDKPDSQNHLSHLAITHKEDVDTLATLQRGFGASMDAKEQSWTVSSASVLRTYLRDKGYKFSDDPWQ